MPMQTSVITGVVQVMSAHASIVKMRFVDFAIVSLRLAELARLAPI